MGTFATRRECRIICRKRGQPPSSACLKTIEQGGSKMPTCLRRFVPCAAAMAVLAVTAAASPAQEKKYKPLVVRAPDGVTIAAQEWGNPSGPEILFIHGFSQASLSWQRQVESDLAGEFRIITYDMRGHGNSDKPLEPQMYKESKAWANE